MFVSCMPVCMCVCEGEFLYVATVRAYIQIFKIDQKLIKFGVVLQGGSSSSRFLNREL